MIELGCTQILITGANGWLGKNLVEYLMQGDSDNKDIQISNNIRKIRCFVLPNEDISFLRNFSERIEIEIITGDLRNPDDCLTFTSNAKGAILFHTAGVIHPNRVKDFYEINVTGISNLLDAAVINKVRRIVVVSSNSPCGTNPHPDHIFDEDSPYRPYLNYGCSKMKMELVVKDRYNHGDIETVIIRPPWFYGPYQPARQTLFFKMIRDGKAPIVGGGENLRSMAYVLNICQGAILAAMHENANGETYWIADERPYTMNEIINTVEKLLEEEFGQECAHKRLKLPGFVSDAAFLMDTVLQGMGLYHQKIHVLSEMNKTIVCSIKKANKELGYNPTVSLEEGMLRSLKWWFEDNRERE